MITAERIEEIEKGCEGVTPGPWGANSEGDIAPHSDQHNAGYWIAHLEDCGPNWKANAAHIARLDPATVRDLCALARSALSPSRVKDDAARQRIYDQLAKEGGGTWAAYMMAEIDDLLAAQTDTDPDIAAVVAANRSALYSTYPALEPSPATVTEGMRVAEALAVIREAEPYVETLHSLVERKETRAQVWAVVKKMRTALSQSPTHRNKQTGAEYVLVCEGKMKADDWEQSHPSVGTQSVTNRLVTTLHSATEGNVTVPSEVFEAEYEEIGK